MSERIRVGVIGCGAISGRYLSASKNFPMLEMSACADLNRQAAEKKAAEFAVPRVLDVEELIADRSIDLVLNLTVPKAHASLCLAALKAGKHVYVEKPLAVTREDGQAILSEAKKRKLLVGCAPDTFLGSGLQTARKAIDDGLIGRPVAFTALMMCPGHEHWHPSPEFYYEVGGGPMLDMGPYYLTALLNCLGPVKRLTGLASVAIPERTILSQPKKGKKMRSRDSGSHHRLHRVRARGGGNDRDQLRDAFPAVRRQYTDHDFRNRRDAAGAGSERIQRAG